jgi:CubicO group peptidase (beta-lactamase class C family)
MKGDRLGVSVLLNPASFGNLGSDGQFGWCGAAPPHVVIDPKEDLVALYFTQIMPGEFSLINRFRMLVYQSIVE